MNFFSPQSYLLGKGERLLIDDGRLSVGHGKDHSDAASKGRGGARGEVLLVGGSRVACVHVHVDETGQTEQPTRRHAVRVGFHWRSFAAQHVHSL